MYFTFFMTVILKNLFWSKVEHSTPLASWKEDAKIQKAQQELVIPSRGLNTAVIIRQNICQDLDQVHFCHDEYCFTK